ncbi:MAG: hypothetical protein ACM3KM_02805 [Acidobacteriaceae bacterium]
MKIEWHKVTWYSKLGAVVVFVFAIAFGTYASLEFQKTKGTDVMDADLLVSNTPKEDPNKPLPEGVKTYTSEKLGVKFNYLEKHGNPILEETGRIFVGGLSGQWVQEFAKDPNDSLKLAIEQKFLKGISSADCYVVTWKGGDEDWEGYSKDFEFGTILYPIDTENPEKAWFDNNKCPKIYRATNGISYFLMDKKHPSKYFFFSIGQYAIFAEPDRPGGGEKVWQQTFQVIK